MLHAISSTSATARLAAAQRFLLQFPPSTEIIVVGASRGAADDLVRSTAGQLGATFGLTRFSLTELAARACAVTAAGAGQTPGTQAAAEAVAARVTFEAVADGTLAYFGPVARTPGFPKALARTLHELRLAGVSVDRLGARQAAGGDLGRLLARVDEERARASMIDRAELFHLASNAWRSGQVPWSGLPVLLLDVPTDSGAEQAFVTALAERAAHMLITIPEGDTRAQALCDRLGAQAKTVEDAAPATSDLAHLRGYVFTSDRPPLRDRAGDVRLFSAPGEGRESVEIVRRVLDEAARGVPFDDMAVLLRAPQHYLGLMEHACDRGGVPVYFDRGTRRPDPAGRAFIALLSCGVEGLSAKRFDEYLSLGQVPRLVRQTSAAGAVPAALVLPADELFDGRRGDPDDSEGQEVESREPDPIDSDDEAVVAGTLRAPWKWEELIVESAVVGGRTRQEGKARWRRRLDGLAAEYRCRLEALRRDEPESARIGRYERDLRNLAHLRSFALPIIDALADWPDVATWGDWMPRLSALAQEGLARPGRVLQVLADLRPMSAVGPVPLEEVRDVLRDRLVMLDWDPPAHRYGRLFVGTPHQARGRSFRVVFVPGLAERVVPQRPREDPLLLDASRADVDPALIRQDDRGSAERLLLKLALGAASERVYLSYPRMDVAETRARVPSFYALDVMRAITGRIPDHRALAVDAAEEAGASLAWPAPIHPERAIDDLEHDLAVLKPLIDAQDAATVRGRAHYLLGLNDALARSIRGRWRRSQKAWSSSDGLVAVTPGIQAAIRASRLGQRAYSLSALQRFSSCPYQFLLATIHRLEPWDQPEPLVRMDPLVLGNLFHRAQAEFFRVMQARQALPVAQDRVDEAVRIVDEVLEAVAADYEERCAPAIERVWRDEVHEIRRDLGIWVQRLADDPVWVPAYFEFSFGLNDEGRDERSLPQPVTIDHRFILRGSVDLIEHRADRNLLRVTDHKTGKNRSHADLIVGRGTVLQPVLYSLAVEEALHTRVAQGRLFYCTTSGGFAEHAIDLTDDTRSQGLQVLAVIDRAIEQGFLPAAPAEGACAWCEFRPVCGPREEARVTRKAADRLADLSALRSMR